MKRLMISENINTHPYISLCIYFIIIGVLYVFVSTTALYSPFVLYPTFIDELIPVMPVTAYFYMSYFILMPSCVLLYRNTIFFKDLFLTCFYCNLTNLAINFFFPTQICRMAEDQEVAGALLSFIYAVDNAACAFPSAHVSLPVCIFFATYSVRSKFCWVYLFWSILLIFTTLTTKQHYFPDIVGGVLLGVIFGKKFQLNVVKLGAQS